MKIGISINYKRLNDFKSIFSNVNIKIQHVQISGLPAEITTISNELVKSIRDFRSKNQNVELSLHAYPYNFAESIEKVRKVWIDLAQETIQVARELNAVFVNFHSGYCYDAATRIRHAACRESVVSVIQQLLKTAQLTGVEIHLENLYPESRNSDFTKLGDRLSDFNYFFDQVQDPLFKLCYDYGHGNLDEHGIDILRGCVDKLGSLHVHDNDQLADIHWPIGQPSLGTIDWKSEIDFLQNINFTGPFILESYLADQIKSLEYLEKMRIT